MQSSQRWSPVGGESAINEDRWCEQHTVGQRELATLGGIEPDLSNAERVVLTELFEDSFGVVAEHA